MKDWRRIAETRTQEIRAGEEVRRVERMAPFMALVLWLRVLPRRIMELRPEELSDRQYMALLVLGSIILSVVTERVARRFRG